MIPISIFIICEGYINAQELKTAIEALKFDSATNTISRTIEELSKLTDKHIYFDSFIEHMTTHAQDKDTREDIEKAFKVFDEEGRGKLTADSIRSAAKKLNEHITEDDIKAMIQLTDTNNDGVVTLDDFYMLMSKKVFK